jgi:hypothetical protein
MTEADEWLPASGSVVAAAEFHKMPLLVQTWDVKPMDCRKFPSVRNVFQLVCRVSTFHRKESPAADT